MIKKKIYNYILPDENNNPVSKETKCNSIIIIGANGSGKTRLGAWIEKNMIDETHRISAQRALTFGTYIKQKSYEQAINLVIIVGDGMVKNTITSHQCLMIMRMCFLL